MTRRRLRLLAATALLQILAGCVTLTSDPRGIFLGASGTTEIAWLKCDAAAKLLQSGAVGVAGNTEDMGVMTASRVAPIASCIQRADEPYLGIPKSAVISWFPLADSADTVAVINTTATNVRRRLTSMLVA